MENENNQTINLGNNVGGVQAPVFEGTRIVTPENTANQVNANTGYIPYVTSPVIPTPQSVETGSVTISGDNVKIEMPQYDVSVTQNMHSQVVTAEPNIQEKVEEVAPADEGIPQTPIKIDNNVMDIKIPLALLRNLVGVAGKVGVANEVVPRSKILLMNFNEAGITLKATDGTICTSIVDNTYVFTKPISTSVDITLFADVLKVLDSVMITIKFDDVHRVIMLETDNGGVYKFPQRMDDSGNVPNIDDLMLDIPYDSMKVVDYNKFLSYINTSKLTMNSAKIIDDDSYQGMYFGNLVIASDTVVLLAIVNELDLNVPPFYLGAKYISILKAFPFNIEKFRVGFIINPDTNVVEDVAFSDDKYTVFSPVRIPSDYPSSTVESYWSANDYEYEIEVKSADLIKLIKPILPFISSENNKNRLRITISGNDMTITDVDGYTNCHIAVQNNSGLNVTQPFELPAKHLYNLLQSINEPVIKMCTNAPDKAPAMSLPFGNNKAVIAYLHDNY